VEEHSQSPEARRKRLARASARWGHDVVKRWRHGPAPMVVLKRVAIGVYIKDSPLEVSHGTRDKVIGGISRSIYDYFVLTAR
jgi:hypothetical protein